MRTHIRLLGLPAVVLAAAALAAPAHAAQPSTTITLTVQDCEGCTFGVWNTTPAGTADRPLRTVTIRNGKAAFRIRTAQTKGLALDWDDPRRRYQLPGAVPAVSMALPQHRPGSAVSEAQARRATRAHYCWAGTKAAAHTIALKLTTFRTKDYYGEGWVTGAAIWASPTLRGHGTVRRLEKGPEGEPPISGMGHQDAPYCGR
ncbi:hypothetical protein [Motilibacter aurantiacus]|uniref:hypothetical protein n=1 Tax=Motilibacter aurantiacus TaxID=2714955 RepID=UPI00140BA08A|nr:hypothetical protein [Motilibacter aurantiacus]NHC43904.1 hypothetical protein [Motilibacter aurantiacus]